MGLGAGASLTAAGIAGKLLGGVALTALSRALMPTPGSATSRPAGVSTSVSLGEDAPANIILGKFAVEMKADNILWQGSASGFAGPENAFLSVAVELCDFPTTLRRVMVNGEWCTLGPTPREDFGYPVTEFRYKGGDYLWIKFYDGAQLATDPYLLSKFGSYPDRPWTEDMIGPGVTWAVVTAGYGPEVWRGGFPKITFELNGIRLYDPRQDSTAGGSGSQRLNDQSTWSASGSTRNSNLAVQAYNVMVGLRDPVTDEMVFGGDVPQRDMPAAAWFAAMNACDASALDADGDNEPAYRGGYEILLTDDVTPAAVVKDLLDGCQGVVAEVGGLWDVRIGAPGSSVYAFTDADIETLNSPEDFDPFAGIDEAYNGVAATYPEPEDGWRPREAPTRLEPDYVAEDRGRQNIATLSYPAVPYSGQVQRLMEAALRDARRQRRHVLVLPPEAQALGPLDVVEWTSVRNGYEDKLFEVVETAPLASECVQVTLREVDPTDYDYDEENILPQSVGFLGRPRPLPLPNAFEVEPETVLGEDGVTQRPAWRLNWDPTVEARGVAWVSRLKNVPSHVPTAGNLSLSKDDLQADDLLIYEGTPVEIYEGEKLAVSFSAAIALGTKVVSEGVLANTTYEVMARYVFPGRQTPWSPWMEVLTPNLKITADDLEEELRDKIDDALNLANEHADEIDALFAQVAGVRDDLDALSAETIADLQALLDEIGSITVIDDLEALLASLEGLTAADIISARLTGLRGIRGALWNADPAFDEWAAGAVDEPDRWTLVEVGTPTFTKVSGSYGNAIRIETTTGAHGAQVLADSSFAGQMPGADVGAEWVVVAGLATIAAGDPTAIRFRAEWRETATATYRQGHLWRNGVQTANADGTLTQLGLAVDGTRQQGFEFLVRRPVVADRVRVVAHKSSGVSSATDFTVHLLGIRKATDAEIEAGQAAHNLSAAVTTLTTTITGISDTLAAYQIAINARVDGVESNISSNYVTTAALNASQAAQNTSLTASIRGLAAADALIQFYTKSQTDNGIATAVAASRTALEAEIAGVEAAVTSEAAARVSADGALAGRIETIEATSSGNIVVNGDFAAGFTGWTATAGVTVVAKGSIAGTAVASMPKREAARFPTSAATQSLNNKSTTAKEGDVVSASLLCAGAGVAVSGTARLIIQFLTEANTQAGIFFADRAVTNSAWAPLNLLNRVAPAGTASVRVIVQRLAGGSGDIFVTGVSGQIEGAGASARITTAEAATADNTAAIAQVDQRITTEKAATLAQVANTYSSKVETASAIAGSANTINTRITGVEASVTAEAAARSSADGALAGRVEVVEAVNDPGSIVVNGSFTSGSIGWTFEPEVTVVLKGGAGTAQQSAPAPAMARFPTSASHRAIHGKRYDAKAGDQIFASAFYATAGVTRDATLRLMVRFHDAAGDILSSPAVDVTNVSSAAWQQVVTPRYTAPAGTASVRVVVLRLSGGAGDALVTSIDGRKGDPLALARISAVEVTAANASSSIASLRTEINASFGSSSAFVTQAATAVARVNDAASSLVWRFKAGTAVGAIEAVAFSNPSGAAATVRIDADNIDLDGKVSARALLVYDSDNLVPDNQLQDPFVWDPALSEEWATFTSGVPADARSLGEVRYVGTGTTGSAVTFGKMFPVSPGDSLAVSFRMRGNGSPYRAYAQLQWFNASDESISTNSFGVTSTSTAATVAPATEVLAVPAGAFKARWRWVVDRASTSSSYVRFFAPMARRQSQTVEIADGAITGEKITVNSALIGKLQAISAWIGRAQIGIAEIDTLRIAGNAVTIPITVVNNTPVDLPGASYATLVNFNVTMSEAGMLTVFAVVACGMTGGNAAPWNFRLFIDNVQAFNVDGRALTDSVPLLAGRAVGAGTRNVRIEGTGGGTLVVSKNRISVVALGAMR